MKVILTGVAGFIGSNLCAYLLESGYNVVGIDNFNDSYDPKIKEFNISEFKGNHNFILSRVDITDREGLDKLIGLHKDASAIIHLAAWAGVTYSVRNPSIYMDVNVSGTNNLAEFAVKYGVGNFVFASTSSVYGENAVPFREEMNTSYPGAPYPATKKSGEVLLYTYHKNFGISVTNFRFFNPIGPRMRPDLALPKLIKCSEYGYDFPIYMDPDNSARDYTNISDMLKSIEFVVNNPLSYEIMNLGNSNPITLRRLIKIVERITNKKIKTVEDYRPGQMKETCADISKAKKMVGYNPNSSIEDMVQAYYDWFLAQPEWYKKFS